MLHKIWINGHRFIFMTRCGLRVKGKEKQRMLAYKDNSVTCKKCLRLMNV